MLHIIYVMKRDSSIETCYCTISRHVVWLFWCRWSLLEGSMGDAVSCSSSGMKSSRDQRLQHEEQQQLDIMENNSSLLWPPQESGIKQLLNAPLFPCIMKYYGIVLFCWS